MSAESSYQIILSLRCIAQVAAATVHLYFHYIVSSIICKMPFFGLYAMMMYIKNSFKFLLNLFHRFSSSLSFFLLVRKEIEKKVPLRWELMRQILSIISPYFNKCIFYLWCKIVQLHETREKLMWLSGWWCVEERYKSFERSFSSFWSPSIWWIFLSTDCDHYLF